MLSAACGKDKKEDTETDTVAVVSGELIETIPEESDIPSSAFVLGEVTKGTRSIRGQNMFLVLNNSV